MLAADCWYLDSLNVHAFSMFATVCVFKPKQRRAPHCCRYVSSASLETLGQAFKDATLLMQRNYDIFYEELKLSCYQPQVTYTCTMKACSSVQP